MTDRRTFVKSLAGAGVSLPMMRENAFSQMFKANTIAGTRSAQAVAEDELPNVLRIGHQEDVLLRKVLHGPEVIGQ